jgi:hypothetical protein
MDGGSAAAGGRFDDDEKNFSLQLVMSHVFPFFWAQKGNIWTSFRMMYLEPVYSTCTVHSNFQERENEEEIVSFLNC